MSKFTQILAFTFCTTLTFGVSFAAEKQNNNMQEKGKIDIESPMKLESTFVGDKEQPGVSYFIPWKGTSSPDNLHWNIENKNDKTLELIDRDVILRSINIYNEMDLEQLDNLGE